MSSESLRSPFLSVCLAGGLFSSVPAPSAAEDWKPAEAQIPHLAEEVQVDQFAIRPPTGTKRDHRQVGQEDRNVWAIESGGKPTGTVAITFVRRPGDGDMEKGLKALIERLKARTTNLQSGEIETGTVNGQKFARVRFRVDSMPGFPSGPIYGFVYGTQVPEGLVQLTGFGTAETIERLEASAQTFRIAKK